MIEGMRIGFVICGSFCTFERITEQMRILTDRGAVITPIVSFAVDTTDTRFGAAEKWKSLWQEITGNKPLATLPAVEPLGPKDLLDILTVTPCTGTTLSKLAMGQSNTPASLAVKSHLRRERPVVLAVSTNDALAASFPHIATLKNRKHYYFVPMRQDDPVHKPNSLVADFTYLGDTIEAAWEGRQLQPIFLA